MTWADLHHALEKAKVGASISMRLLRRSMHSHPGSVRKPSDRVYETSDIAYRGSLSVEEKARSRCYADVEEGVLFLNFTAYVVFLRRLRGVSWRSSATSRTRRLGRLASWSVRKNQGRPSVS